MKARWTLPECLISGNYTTVSSIKITLQTSQTHLTLICFQSNFLILNVTFSACKWVEWSRCTDGGGICLLIYVWWDQFSFYAVSVLSYNNVVPVCLSEKSVIMTTGKKIWSPVWNSYSNTMNNQIAQHQHVWMYHSDYLTCSYIALNLPVSPVIVTGPTTDCFLLSAGSAGRYGHTTVGKCWTSDKVNMTE